MSISIDESGNFYLIGNSSNDYWYSRAVVLKYEQIPLGMKDNPNILPIKFHLNQNYPNPFNPVTTIQYALPASAQVVLKVYDVLGREVATVVKEYQTAGYKEVNFNASNLPSGVYFYRLSAGYFTEMKKMILAK